MRNEWQFFQRNKQLFSFLEKKVHFCVEPSYFFFLWQKEIEIFYQEERSARFSDHIFSILFFHCFTQWKKIFTVSLNSKKSPWKCFLTTSNMKKTKKCCPWGKNKNVFFLLQKKNFKSLTLSKIKYFYSVSQMLFFSFLGGNYLVSQWNLFHCSISHIKLKSFLGKKFHLFSLFLFDQIMNTGEKSILQ